MRLLGLALAVGALLPAAAAEAATVDGPYTRTFGAGAPATEVVDVRSWSSGDGAYSLRLPSGRTLWAMGDSLVSGWFVRNALLTSSGSIDLRWVSEDATAIEASGAEWFWPKQPVLSGSEVHLLMARMAPAGNPDPMYDFEQVGLDLVTLDASTLEEVRRTRLPWDGAVDWGAAAYRATDGYVYVWGVEQSPSRRAYVARTTNLAARWSYRTEAGDWSQSADAAAEQFCGVSNQFSILKRGARYYRLSQDPGGGAIRLSSAAALLGPYGPGRVVHDAGPGTYNALAHPEQGGALLVNFAITNGAPRFVRVPDAELTAATVAAVATDTAAAWDAAAYPLSGEPPDAVGALDRLRPGQRGDRAACVRG